MNRQISLYSFGDRDRGGKIRWTAYELGYTINEHRVNLGDHREPAYAAINPYQQIPAVIIDDEVMYESTAVCINLAERHPESQLIPEIGDPIRPVFWQQAALATQTLEFPAVMNILSKSGLVNEAWGPLVERRLRSHFAIYVKNVPDRGWWLGDTFTLADIFAAYVLRIAISSEILEYEGSLKNWFKRLMARPAAKQAAFFVDFTES